MINAAAALPVWFGVWSVFALVGLYWFENVTLGVIQFLRMRRVERVQGDRDGLGMSAFFAIHYGIFTFVHGIFVLVFFGFLLPGAHDGGAFGWWLSASMIILIPSIAYRRDYIVGEAARTASLGRLMLEPYARVAVLHLVVLIGAWLALSTSQPRLLLLVLVTLKLVVELFVAWWTTRAVTVSASPRRGI